MLLQCESLTIGYDDLPLVQELNFALGQGEICAVIGHNGAGKSTFVKTLLGLVKPLSGTISWQDGQKETCAYLGQRADFDGQFPIRVRDIVSMGAWHGLGFWGHIDQATQRLIDQALAQTDLTQIADRPLYECSSGQLQRCFFARTIVQDAALILLDEPFTAIDQATEAKLIDIIKGWRDQGRGQILVLHDLSVVKGLCDKVLLLGQGRAIFGTAQDILTPETLLQYAYFSPTQAGWLQALTVGQDD